MEKTLGYLIIELDENIAEGYRVNRPSYINHPPFYSRYGAVEVLNRYPGENRREVKMAKVIVEV